MRLSKEAECVGKGDDVFYAYTFNYNLLDRNGSTILIMVRGSFEM